MTRRAKSFIAKTKRADLVRKTRTGENGNMVFLHGLGHECAGEDPATRALDRKKTLEKTLPILRQVRFEKVTFSFHIVDLESLGIGEELVDLIRWVKERLEPNLERFKLPRLVRLIVWRENLFTQDASGAFGGALPMLSTPFQICINTDNLHEEELASSHPSIFTARLLHLFLHELAHLITTDEKEADKTAFGVLRKIVKPEEKKCRARENVR